MTCFEFVSLVVKFLIVTGLHYYHEWRRRLAAKKNAGGAQN